MSNEINIKAVFLKESSLEIPESPDIFFNTSNEVVTELNCTSSFSPFEINNEDNYEITLALEIIAKDKTHNKILYILNFIYAGFFSLNNYTKQEEIDEALAVDCPNIIFPYARQYVSTITGLTSLPVSLIQDINFKELYYNEIGKEYK
tara:strand:- start:413 stop:856 length:444 start_codon:yes stop_codon:yes gene_type:complete